MVKYLSFQKFCFCLKILLNVNGKAIVWHTLCFVFTSMEFFALAHILLCFPCPILTAVTISLYFLTSIFHFLTAAALLPMRLLCLLQEGGPLDRFKLVHTFPTHSKQFGGGGKPKVQSCFFVSERERERETWWSCFFLDAFMGTINVWLFVCLLMCLLGIAYMLFLSKIMF
jgi:hypothetical protein